MNKINWKYVATTKGYKSLKAAYIHDIQKNNQIRTKAEFLQHFYWVIGRAKHYAHNRNIPIEVVLNHWEKKRTYWWLNYYQDSNQRKFQKKSVS